MTGQTAPGSDSPATSWTLARKRWPWPKRDPRGSEDLKLVSSRIRTIACLRTRLFGVPLCVLVSRGVMQLVGLESP